ncbi:MAG: [FeFe] hydrogenase H-cluster radical SAM maturase HydE [Phycisphaerae bacterium]|nr:[FeFe] hydrogenase H-cluster radical SAM maturase HydE [Phycisphaerae bacterium]
MKPTRSDILNWLREDDPRQLEVLWRLADEVRQLHVGDEVHLRGLIEFSNRCMRSCAYCGLRLPNADLVRYRMTADEVLACAREAVRFGYGTVVLQSGEDGCTTVEWMADLIGRIKVETRLAVTLSLGERSEADLRAWRVAGADRYLLRFETSNPTLFAKIHPSLPGMKSDRIAILRVLRELGYEVGSGVMIGIPGQTWADLVRDIELFAELDLDMIGVGPFIPHPATPLGGRALSAGAGLEQVPNTELMTYKVVALARLVCPEANIPSTTALATLNLAQGRELGLQRGANVVMPNLTPPQYRERYEIYPAKACVRESASDCHGCMRQRIETIGRAVGVGRGDSRNYHLRG